MSLVWTSCEPAGTRLTTGIIKPAVSRGVVLTERERQLTAASSPGGPAEEIEHSDTHRDICDCGAAALLFVLLVQSFTTVNPCCAVTTDWINNVCSSREF